MISVEICPPLWQNVDSHVHSLLFRMRRTDEKVDGTETALAMGLAMVLAMVLLSNDVPWLLEIVEIQAD